MRVQLAIILVVAGGVAGCARTPPPMPPMAAMEAPVAPPPAPVAVMPAPGNYRGPVVATADSRPRCRTMPATASTRVRNNSTFMLGGMQGRIGPDGAVTMAAARGRSMTGMLANNSLEVTTMNAGCGYRYSLARV